MTQTTQSVITNRDGKLLTCDGPDAVRAFALRVLAGALKLELRCPGIKASRMSALKQAKQVTGLKSNKREVQLAEVERLLKEQIEKCVVVNR